MTSTLIRLDNLSKVYGTGNTAVHALNQINLRIQTGEYCSIMGASGSGKSTAMNIIGCLDRPTAGHYYFDQRDVSLLPNATLADIRNRKIGFVFQQFHLLPHLTAMDNVTLPLIYAGISATERKDRAVIALERVGLGSRLYNKPNQLSGGQQQRVAIARAIVNQPRLLLADEPTGALDSRTVREILAIFQELHETGITVVMVTHEVEVARESQRIVWFRDGEVIYDHLTPEQMLEVAIR